MEFSLHLWRLEGIAWRTEARRCRANEV